MGIGFFEPKKPGPEDIRAQMVLINKYVEHLNKASDNPFNAKARELLIDLNKELGEIVDTGFQSTVEYKG